MSGIAQYYRTLELENGASPEEVKQAYKDLATVWHPDRFSNNVRLQQKAQDKLKEINRAYEQLKSRQLNFHHSHSYTSPPKQPQRPPQPSQRQSAPKQSYQSSQRQSASRQSQHDSKYRESKQAQSGSKHAADQAQSGPKYGASKQSQQDSKYGASKQTQQSAQSERSRPGKRHQYDPIISLQVAKAILAEYKFKLIRKSLDYCTHYESGPFWLDIRVDIPKVVLSVPCDSVGTFHRALLSIPCKSVGTFHQSEAQELINLFCSLDSQS